MLSAALRLSCRSLWQSHTTSLGLMKLEASFMLCNVLLPQFPLFAFLFFTSAPQPPFFSRKTKYKKGCEGAFKVKVLYKLRNLQNPTCLPICGGPWRGRGDAYSVPVKWQALHWASWYYILFNSHSELARLLFLFERWDNPVSRESESEPHSEIFAFSTCSPTLLRYRAHSWWEYGRTTQSKW